jgi:hypothetical protein
VLWVLQGGGRAVDISNTPAGSIAATNVQAAINELATDKAPLASPSFTGSVNSLGSITVNGATAYIRTIGDLGSITTTGEIAYIRTSGELATISTTGESANISTYGANANIITNQGQFIGAGTGLTGTAASLTAGSSNGLKSATTTVSVSASTAPTTGQVLTATSSTAATWQTPSGSTYTAGTGLTLTGSVFSVTAGTYAPARSIQTTSFDAVVGGRYTLYNTGSVASITDPTGTAAGQSYTVIMAAGLARFNGAGTQFAASRFELIRSYDGSAWSTLAPRVSDALTVGANGNTWDGSTFTGAQAFSSTTLPTSSGTNAPTPTSLVHLAAATAHNYLSRRVFPNCASRVLGAASVARRGAAAGVIDGDITTTSLLGDYFRVDMLGNGAGSFLANPDAGAVHLQTKWSLMTRVALNYGTNTHAYLTIGDNGNSGIPASGISVGVELTSPTTAKLYYRNGASLTQSAQPGTISGITTATATQDLFFWVDCDGAGGLALYFATKTMVGGTIPAKPTTPIATLTGLASAWTGTGAGWNIRATANNPQVYSALQFRDAVFTEI